MSNFLNLGLSEKTVRAIGEAGIENPTTVQSDVIPSILQGKDVFTIAPQKCGKTMSYVFPLVDIISKQNKQNILIITPSSEESVLVSDKLAAFNRYHENEQPESDENDNEANVIIGSPDLLLETVAEGKIDISNINILVVDDINLIKRNRQLDNLSKLLEMLPVDKQNIVYTNRRSRETQDILDKVLKAPQEFKVDKNKEQEAETAAAQSAASASSIPTAEPIATPAPAATEPTNATDAPAVEAAAPQVEAPRERKFESRRERFARQREERRERREQRQRESGETGENKVHTNENKVHENRESRVHENRENSPEPVYHRPQNVAGLDEEALSLSKKFNSFNGRTPKFILSKSVTAADGE